MSTAKKLLSGLILTAALAGCSTTVEHPRGRPCERCSHGYAPVNPTKHDERRVVCIVHGKIMNCDQVPAECGECARIQRRDLDERAPETR
jgi:hypothetical protein